jgi:hypothetical protein
MSKKNNIEKNNINKNILTEEQKKDLEIIKKKEERNKMDNDLKNEAVNLLKNIENNSNKNIETEGKKLNYWEKQKLESQKRLEELKQMKNLIDKLENRKKEIKYEKNEMTSEQKKNIGKMINVIGNGPINQNNLLIQQQLLMNNNNKNEK